MIRFPSQKQPVRKYPCKGCYFCQWCAANRCRVCRLPANVTEISGCQPEEKIPRSDKKYPCPDCAFCLWCADSRCQLCLKTKQQ